MEVCRVAWTSTYTYILLLFVAAAFVAYIARPRSRGEAVQRLLAVTLIDGLPEGGPRLSIRCLEGAKVHIERLGVENLTVSGAISLAVSFVGKDVEIKERVSYGYPADAPVCGAMFDIDMTGYEWRHVKWIDEETGLWCAFTLHVRPGIKFEVTLRREQVVTLPLSPYNLAVLVLT